MSRGQNRGEPGAGAVGGPRYEKDPDEVGVLWEKEATNGNTYLSGTIDGIGAVVVFRNTRRTSDRSPAYRVLRARRRDREPGGKETS